MNSNIINNHNNIFNNNAHCIINNIINNNDNSNITNNTNCINTITDCNSSPLSSYYFKEKLCSMESLQSLPPIRHDTKLRTCDLKQHSYFQGDDGHFRGDQRVADNINANNNPRNPSTNNIIEASNTPDIICGSNKLIRTDNVSNSYYSTNENFESRSVANFYANTKPVDFNNAQIAYATNNVNHRYRITNNINPIHVYVKTDIPNNNKIVDTRSAKNENVHSVKKVQPNTNNLNSSNVNNTDSYHKISGFTDALSNAPLSHTDCDVISLQNKMTTDSSVSSTTSKAGMLFSKQNVINNNTMPKAVHGISGNGHANLGANSNNNTTETNNSLAKKKTTKGSTKNSTGSKKNKKRNKHSLMNEHNFFGNVTGENYTKMLQFTNECHPFLNIKEDSFHDRAKEYPYEVPMFDIAYTTGIPNGTVFKGANSTQIAAFSNTHTDINECQPLEGIDYWDVSDDMSQSCISEPKKNTIQTIGLSCDHFINSATNIQCTIDPHNTFLPSASSVITPSKNLSGFTSSESSVTHETTDLNKSSTSMLSAINLSPIRNSPHPEQTNSSPFLPPIISLTNEQNHNSLPLISSTQSISNKVIASNYQPQSMHFGHIITSNCDSDNMSFSIDNTINTMQKNPCSDSNQYQNIAQVDLGANSYRTAMGISLDLLDDHAIPVQISQENAKNGFDSTQTTIFPLHHASTPAKSQMSQDSETISCSENTSDVQLNEDVSHKASSKVIFASHKEAAYQSSRNHSSHFQKMHEKHSIEFEKEIKDKLDAVPSKIKDGFNSNIASMVECNFAVESLGPISTTNGKDETDCEIIDVCETDSCNTTLPYPQASTPEQHNAHTLKLYQQFQDKLTESSPLIMSKRYHYKMTPTSLLSAKGSAETCETTLQIHTRTQHLNHDCLDIEKMPEQHFYKHTDMLSPIHSSCNPNPKSSIIDSKTRDHYNKEMKNDTGNSDHGSKNEYTEDEKAMSFLELKEYEVFDKQKHCDNHKTIHPGLLMSNVNQSYKNASVLKNDGSYLIIEDIVENTSRSSTPPLIIDESFEDDQQLPENLNSVTEGEEQTKSTETFNSCTDVNNVINISNLSNERANTADRIIDNSVLFIEDSYSIHKESDTFNLSYDSDSESDDDKNRELDNLLRLGESIKRYLGDPNEQNILQRNADTDYHACTLSASPNAKNESCLPETRESNNVLYECYYEDISEDESWENYYEHMQTSERIVEVDKYPSILPPAKSANVDSTMGKWLTAKTSGISKLYYEDISENESLGNYDEIYENTSPDIFTPCIFVEDRSDDYDIQENMRIFSGLGWIHNFKETIPVEMKPINIQGKKVINDHDNVKNVMQSTKKSKEWSNCHQFNFSSNLNHSTNVPISCELIQSMPREGAIILDNSSTPTKFSPDNHTRHKTITPTIAYFTEMQTEDKFAIKDTLNLHKIAESNPILKDSEEYTSVLGKNDKGNKNESDRCDERLATTSNEIIIYPKSNNNNDVANDITQQYENVWRLERRQFSNEDLSNEKHRPNYKMEYDSLETTNSFNRDFHPIESENVNQGNNEIETFGSNVNIRTQHLNTSRFYEESMPNQYSETNSIVLGGPHNHFYFNGENNNPPDLQLYPKDDSRPVLEDQLPICRKTSEKQCESLCNEGTIYLTENITKNPQEQNIKKASFTSSQTDYISLSPLKIETQTKDPLLLHRDLESFKANVDHVSGRATQDQEGTGSGNHENGNTPYLKEGYGGASPATDRFIQAMAAAIKEEILSVH